VMKLRPVYGSGAEQEGMWGLAVFWKYSQAQSFSRQHSVARAVTAVYE
jgi:hypothetical protein